jgi:hypothetical protein
MSMTGGTPDHLLLPGTVDKDEIEALEGTDSIRGGPGDEMLSRTFGRGFLAGDLLSGG